ncbi:unnamed protein product [Rhodiola kirilowii]
MFVLKDYKEEGLDQSWHTCLITTAAAAGILIPKEASADPSSTLGSCWAFSTIGAVA